MKKSKKTKRERASVLISEILVILNKVEIEKCSLFHLRNVGFVIMGFFGFLRVSELRNLTFQDVKFFKDRTIVRIERSKTDRKEIVRTSSSMQKVSHQCFSNCIIEGLVIVDLNQC